MPEAILVFDVGTTNFKTFLIDPDGNVAFSRSRPFRPVHENGGLVLQNPLDWREALADGATHAAAEALGGGRRVAAVVLTASRSSVIPVDRNGDHLAPALMWQETASRDIVNRLTPAEREAVYRRCGSRPNTVYSAPKMAWLKQRRPDVYAAAHKLAGIQDYLIRFLTGRFVTDHTFGSRTLLMDIRTRAWEPDMLALFGVDGDKLCVLVPPGSVVGKVTAAAAAVTGLEGGTPVVTAGGDQQCAALGTGVIRHGDAVVNMGTGSFLVAAVDSPVVDPGMRVMLNASAIPEKWIIDAGMLTTGSVHTWFAEHFFPELPEADLPARYARAEEEAALAPPGADGLLLLPHFSGCGAPHWDNRARGAFCGLGLGHRRRHLARAVFEGIACEVAGVLDVADELLGRAARVRLAGGLTRSRFFDQLLADVTGRTVGVSHGLEATVRGAWSQAMIALGWAADHADALSRWRDGGREEEFRPNAGLAEAYAGVKEERRRLYECLGGMREGR